jgi:hypothetical protein
MGQLASSGPTQHVSRLSAELAIAPPWALGAAADPAEAEPALQPAPDPVAEAVDDAVRALGDGAAAAAVG